MRNIADILNAENDTSYQAQIKSEAWQKRSLAHRSKNPSCHSCGRTANTHTHHVNYHFGVLLHAADDTELVTLCAECHRIIGEAIRGFRKTASFCNASNAARIQLVLEALIQKHGDREVMLKLATLI